MKIPRPTKLMKRKLYDRGNFCSVGYLAHHLLKFPVSEINTNNFFLIKSLLLDLLSIPQNILDNLVDHNDKALSVKERLQLFENFCEDNNIELTDAP